MFLIWGTECRRLAESSIFSSQLPGLESRIQGNRCAISERSSNTSPLGLVDGVMWPPVIQLQKVWYLHSDGSLIFRLSQMAGSSIELCFSISLAISLGAAITTLEC